MCLFISLQSYEQYTGRGKRQWQCCLPIISTSTPSSHMIELTSWSHCSRWQHVLSSGQLNSEWKSDVSWPDKSIKLPMWDISELSFSHMVTGKVLDAALSAWDLEWLWGLEATCQPC